MRIRVYAYAYTSIRVCVYTRISCVCDGRLFLSGTVVLILLHLLLSSRYKRAGGGGDMKFDMLGMDVRGVKKPGNHSKHVPSLSKLLTSPSDHNPMPICPSNVQLRKMCTISYVKGVLVPPFEFVGQKTI